MRIDKRCSRVNSRLVSRGCRILFERCSWWCSRCWRWNRFSFPPLHFPFMTRLLTLRVISFHWFVNSGEKARRIWVGIFYSVYNKRRLWKIDRFLDYKIWIEILFLTYHIYRWYKGLSFFFFFKSRSFKVALISRGKYCKIHYESLNEPSGADISGQVYLFIFSKFA